MRNKKKKKNIISIYMSNNNLYIVVNNGYPVFVGTCITDAVNVCPKIPPTDSEWTIFLCYPNSSEVEVCPLYSI